MTYKVYNYYYKQNEYSLFCDKQKSSSLFPMEIVYIPENEEDETYSKELLNAICSKVIRSLEDLNLLMNIIARTFPFYLFRVTIKGSKGIRQITNYYYEPDHTISVYNPSSEITVNFEKFIPKKNEV